MPDQRAEAKALGSTEQETATRATLSEEWKAAAKKIDWMHAPHMAEYVNQLVSGKALAEGGHWSIYAREQHVGPLSQRLGRELSMVSLACGSGHVERSLLVEFGWPVSRFLGLEFDQTLRSAAEGRFKTVRCESAFRFFDFNKPLEIDERFDVVFCCHSIHHATDIEQLLRTANSLLRDDGLFIGIDYFGPTRFQVEYDVLPLIAELFSVLPSELRRDLRTESRRVLDTFTTDTIDAVRQADPSESVRSSDLRTLLFATFPVIEVKPMGGTLLRWLLQNRAGNFLSDNPDHLCIARLLQIIERELIASKRIKSDDLFFVLRKSSRMGEPT